MLQQRGLQQILRISYRDRITSEEVLRRAGTCSLADVVAKRRFRFVGHILRAPPQCPAKITITWFPRTGERKQGQPMDDLKTVNITWDETVAPDRRLWRFLAARYATRRRRN